MRWWRGSGTEYRILNAVAPAISASPRFRSGIGISIRATLADPLPGIALRLRQRRCSWAGYTASEPRKSSAPEQHHRIADLPRKASSRVHQNRESIYGHLRIGRNSDSFATVISIKTDHPKKNHHRTYQATQEYQHLVRESRVRLKITLTPKVDHTNRLNRCQRTLEVVDSRIPNRG